MEVRGIEIKLVQEIKSQLNKIYKDNIIWNRAPEHHRNAIRFTLRVLDSAGPGAKKTPLRRTASCCWHVHGHAIDMLLDMGATVKVAFPRETKISCHSQNWEDHYFRNYDMMASELCECDN